MSGDLSSATAPVLLIDKQPTHWTLTLNRPEMRNALSSDLIEALLAACSDWFNPILVKETRQALRSTQAVSGPIRPRSSARPMNSPGRTRPR